MGKNRLCALVFGACLALHLLEVLVLRTDETVLGENFLHKALGVVILWLALRAAGLHWREIGFTRRGGGDFLRGLGLGLLCFAAGFAVEWAILALRGAAPRLAVYVSGFSLSGGAVRHTEAHWFLWCAAVNLLNVWMEEGVFRGLFGNLLKRAWVPALLFGLWHLVLPLRMWLDGEIPAGGAALLGLGYVMLSGLMGFKWQWLRALRGNLWMGMGDHLFNNLVATNLLHVVTAGGADELQIVRVALAQLLSCLLVYGCVRRARKGGIIV